MSEPKIVYKGNQQHRDGKGSLTVSHHKIQLGDSPINYSVIRSKRLKTSEVIVDENSVVIRVPYNKPHSEIDNILRRKGYWIIERKQEFRKARRQIKKSNFEIGSTLPYLGKNYRIANDPHNSNEHLEFKRGQFLVSGDNISEMYDGWLIQKSPKLFHNKVKVFSRKLDLKPPKIIIKNLRNRWGSVTKNGVLNLNVNLLKAPNEVIDYVVAHELCHLVIKKHSHHFWDLLRKIMPMYKDSMAWLERNASLLISNSCTNNQEAIHFNSHV
jgi:predicted metal-dependent hydrolase